MAKKFSDYVHLRHDDGTIRSFAPGDKVPGWAEEHITNAAVVTTRTAEQAKAEHEEREAREQAAREQADREAAQREQAEHDAEVAEREKRAEADRIAAEEAEEQRKADEANTLAIPPKNGPGSGKEAWVTYAKAAVEKAGGEIEIEAGDKREDIIAALVELGIPTEAPAAEDAKE